MNIQPRHLEMIAPPPSAGNRCKKRFACPKFIPSRFQKLIVYLVRPQFQNLKLVGRINETQIF
jgi:hypothetical protein